MPFSKPNNRPRRRYRKRSTKKALATKAQVTAMMKKVSLSQCETIRSNKYDENFQLFHNTTRYVTGLLATVQGDTNPGGHNIEGTRTGQEVVAKGLSVKLWLSNKYDRPNCMYKIILFKYPTRGTVFVGDTMLWQGQDGNGSTMNRMIDSIATNRVKVLAQRIIVPKSEFIGTDGFGREKSHLKEIYIPMKDQKIRYQYPNAPFPSFFDIGLAVVAYDAYGTLVTDDIATFAYSSRFTYKDP